MRLQGFIFLLISLLFAASPALAQWKWKDARGQVVVSDIPPPRDIPDRDVLQKPELVLRRPVAAPVAASGASAPDAAAKPKVDAELEARRKKAEQDQADRQKADEEKVAAGRAENCKRARAHLGSLESGMRLARSNDKGEREILDDKARAEEMARTRQIISTDCR
jgi:hypothetical protein